LAWNACSGISALKNWLPFVGVAVVITSVAIGTGSLVNYPINDDWAYVQSAFDLAHTGSFTFPSFSTASIVVHILWGALFCAGFGASFSVLHVSTFVLSLLGGAFVYRLSLDCGSSKSFAALVTASILLTPIYFLLRSSGGNADADPGI
jgi:hypothetical protein